MGLLSPGSADDSPENKRLNQIEILLQAAEGSQEHLVEYMRRDAPTAPAETIVVQDSRFPPTPTSSTPGRRRPGVPYRGEFFHTTTDSTQQTRLEQEHPLLGPLTLIHSPLTHGLQNHHPP